MIEVTLSSYNVYRPKLLKYASNLLRGRGFTEKQGELKAFSEDIVQNAYFRFSKCRLDAFVDEKHLENVLISFVLKEHINGVDLNRRGAQYLLLKSGDLKMLYNTEFKQLNIRNAVKPTQDQFDTFTSFKTTLKDRESLVLDELLKGFSQIEASENLKLGIKVINTDVAKIREKYVNWEDKRV